MVMREVLLPPSIGLVGIPSAMALGLTVVSAVAGLIPAHRASRIDPILALRYQ
jgi:ABC-type lipoprotein release transport system permease subunit